MKWKWPWVRRKKRVPKKTLIVALLIFGIFASTEPLLLLIFNKVGTESNSSISLHAEDLDISFIKGAFVLQKLDARLKKDGTELIKVKALLMDLAWRELLEGKISFDLGLYDTKAFVSKRAINVIKRDSAKVSNNDETGAKEKKTRKLPLKISSINFTNTEIFYLDLPGFYQEKYAKLVIKKGTIKNILRDKRGPLSSYTFTGTLANTGTYTLNGQFDLVSNPPRWDAHLNLEHLKLPALNNVLIKKLPANFKNGTADLYTEVKSEHGKIIGYIKPHLTKVEFMGNKKEFKGSKQFFIELLGAIADWAGENSKKKSVATRVPFIYEDGEFHIEKGEAIKKAIKHGVTETKKVSKGLENKYRLNALDPKEAQAQEEDLKREKKK